VAIDALRVPLDVGLAHGVAGDAELGVGVAHDQELAERVVVGVVAGGALQFAVGVELI
jgi:hypothetical protein